MKKMNVVMNKKIADKNGFAYMEIAGDIVAVLYEVEKERLTPTFAKYCGKATWDGFAETEANFPIQKAGLGEMLGKLSGQDFSAEDAGVLVITNQYGFNGAGALFYKGVLAALKDYYLVPSSIHEWLAVPKSLGDVEFLKATIRLVNATEVAPDEVLSDRPYKAVFRGKWTIEEA